MGDQEDNWMEDASAEQEGGENAENERQTKTRVAEETPTAEKTEAQLLIEAKLRKHEEEDAERIREIEEQRRVEREKQEEELRRLKEKQAQRQKQREEEERILEEQKRQQEEQRRREEEARKTKAEEEKRRKQEEAERKKAAAQAAMAGGRNFVIEKEKTGSSTIDKFMNISKAKTEMSLNAGELETLKKKTVADRLKPLAVEELDNAGLKRYAEELWKQIIQLETAKYDLAERFTRQEYDIKELNERQRQINMKKYVVAGGDVEGGAGAAAAGRHPPKVQLISKYERRTDRRTFGERKSLFEWDASREPAKETQKPQAKKRETWIREKGAEEERRNYTYDDDDEEPPQRDDDQPPAKRASYAAPAAEEAPEEELAAEE
ncbi:troponin T, skeletal muscle-like [Paramacrobiotus metropolitanus]|uniref:troponin T, skeletal muscle-like n=1 Tax=Paramacrobiotus metropolitanus TaxID=2943436 RepID=UPI002446375B|nr:troponin T, skeletal muscle-like [Paramacrobiotus metropolitanus]